MANNKSTSFDIKKLCYELYKNDWMREHGITHDMQQDALKNYYEEFSACSSEYTFEDYLLDYGFAGKIYACFDEFLDNEYFEEEYMCNLLDDTNLIDLYLRDIHPVPKKKTYEVLMDEFGIGETRAKEIAQKLAPAFREEEHFLNGREMLDRGSNELPENLDISKLSDSDIAYLDILFEDELADEVEEGYVEQAAIKQWLEHLRKGGVL